MPYSSDSPPIIYAEIGHSGGILAGAIRQVQKEFFERKTGLPSHQLFSAGAALASVSTIDSTMSHVPHPEDESRVLYDAQKCSELFDKGAALLSPPHIRNHYARRMIEEVAGLGIAGLTEAITLGAKSIYFLSDRFFDASHKLPTPIITRTYATPEHRIYMNTTKFDEELYRYLGHIKLKDLRGSIVYTAALDTDDPRQLPVQFYKIERPDGSVEYSSTTKETGEVISHAELSMYDIIKACIAIPGVIKPHYIEMLGQSFKDNGHAFNAARHIIPLRDNRPNGTEFGAVTFGKAVFPIPKSDFGLMHAVLTGHLKDTTCNQIHQDTEALLEDIYRNRFHDLSIYMFAEEFKKAGYGGAMPKNSILDNEQTQRDRIRRVVQFDLEERRSKEMNALADHLRINAERILEMKARGLLQESLPSRDSTSRIIDFPQAELRAAGL
jgi:hypothetical protein